jgi:hypothetical protein
MVEDFVGTVGDLALWLLGCATMSHHVYYIVQIARIIPRSSGISPWKV